MLYTAVIDRPMHSRHPKHPDIVYPVNYGYIPGIIAGDGAAQDVYVLGVEEPLETFTGELIAVIHRRDDVEDKWVLAPEGVRFTRKEIMAAVHFQEQYFDSYCVLDDAPLILHRVDASTLEAALAIRLECLRDVGHLSEEYAFPAEFQEATRRFFREADQTTFLFLQGDVPVACATLCYKTCIPTLGHPTGKRAHLMNVYTRPDFRHRGLAKRLLTLLHWEAAGRGVTEITLDATEEGRKLYERMGYAASDEAMYLDIGR